MSRVDHSFACGLPFCQKPNTEQTESSLGLRITIIALSSILMGVVGAALLKYHIPLISALDPAFQYALVGTGFLGLVLSLAIKRVRTTQIAVEKGPVNGNKEPTKESTQPEVNKEPIKDPIPVEVKKPPSGNPFIKGPLTEISTLKTSGTSFIHYPHNQFMIVREEDGGSWLSVYDIFSGQCVGNKIDIETMGAAWNRYAVVIDDHLILGKKDGSFLVFKITSEGALVAVEKTIRQPAKEKQDVTHLKLFERKIVADLSDGTVFIYDWDTQKSVEFQSAEIKQIRDLVITKDSIYVLGGSKVEVRNFQADLLKSYHVDTKIKGMACLEGTLIIATGPNMIDTKGEERFVLHNLQANEDSESVKKLGDVTILGPYVENLLQSHQDKLFAPLQKGGIGIFDSKGDCKAILGQGEGIVQKFEVKGNYLFSEHYRGYSADTICIWDLTTHERVGKFDAKIGDWKLKDVQGNLFVTERNEEVQLWQLQK